jgi:hypothetical protein
MKKNNYDIEYNKIYNYCKYELFIPKIDWKYVCQYFKLSEEFMNKYCDKLDWCTVSQFQKLSENFINKYCK